MIPLNGNDGLKGGGGGGSSPSTGSGNSTGGDCEGIPPTASSAAKRKFQPPVGRMISSGEVSSHTAVPAPRSRRPYSSIPTSFRCTRICTQRSTENSSLCFSNKPRQMFE